MSSSAVGRPRVTPGRQDLDARGEILEAAASLFAERGFAATSTRQIAERAGMRQASMYYHFGGKEQILLALLEASVEPTLPRAAEALAGDDPVRALYELARTDVETLLAEPYNIGTMYLSPELGGDAFASFRQERARLVDAYGTLAARVGPDDVDVLVAGTACMQLVEMVITLRRAGTVPPALADTIAAACLRVVGVSAEEIARVRTA